ncbi:MAG: enoyl-CoA hydratase/isomerase family protein [Rhodospirillales bacterium]|jgi:enoyl-CoA hydratase|nr:enoyl-CoA hydratase/isomerase family protein [Rhodospirillales bacterium]MDP6788556.1 enoyl-CoA hydratase/isomerase family protein [Rhodospirillales bacterium]
MNPVDDEPVVLAERRGQLGRITLNRPDAFNSINVAMWRALDAAISDFDDDPAVASIVVEGAGDKAFSAGGDLHALHGALTQGDFETPLAMVGAACAMNYRMRTLATPSVALLDGVVMGSGCSLAISASHRIATERTRFAMPEAGIGFHPDGGAHYFLPRCPGETGMYLALTGTRITAADALYMGLATAYVPSERLADLIGDLAGGDAPDDVAAKFAEDAGAPTLPSHEEAIERCFSKSSVASIVGALEDEESDWAAHTVDTLSGKAPFSLELTFRALRAGRGMGVEDSLIMENRLSTRMLGRSDFLEGIRTILVDKGDTPKWRPASLAEINDAEVEACFAPLDGGDLVLP